MKKSVVLLVIALIMNVTFVSAEETNPKNNTPKIAEELTALLRPTSAVGELDKENIVKVKIRVNSVNEIVVLEVNSTSNELTNYIKRNLNYKTLNSNELKRNEDYVFEVKFKA